MNKDRKSAVKKSVFALIILALLIAMIGGTYARYSSSTTASGSVSIAKWAVKVNDTNISNATTTFDLTFTASNTDTVPNKVAPNGQAIAYVDVDLTGTEVSVDFTCALAEAATTNLTSVFGADYADKVTLTVGTPELLGETSNMTLNGTTVTVGTAAMDGKVRVPVTLTWTNDNANNVADTNTGVTETELVVPVTLTVQQHI